MGSCSMVVIDGISRTTGAGDSADVGPVSPGSSPPLGPGAVALAAPALARADAAAAFSAAAACGPVGDSVV